MPEPWRAPIGIGEANRIEPADVLPVVASLGEVVGHLPGIALPGHNCERELGHRSREWAGESPGCPGGSRSLTGMVPCWDEACFPGSAGGRPADPGGH